MSKRKQLNTDISLAILSQLSLLSLGLTTLLTPKISRQDRDAMRDTVMAFVAASDKLVERSKKLDKED